VKTEKVNIMVSLDKSCGVFVQWHYCKQSITVTNVVLSLDLPLDKETSVRQAYAAASEKAVAEVQGVEHATGTASSRWHPIFPKPQEVTLMQACQHCTQCTCPKPTERPDDWSGRNDHIRTGLGLLPHILCALSCVQPYIHNKK
jgi:hypothetical protein